VRRISGALIVLRVTGYAFGGEPHENSRGCVLMALRAFHNSVRAEKRESVEVLRNRLHRHLPAENRVTLSAVGAELSAVNVRMASGAILADVSENRSGMTPCARYFFVHSAQRIARGVVVEFGNGANRGPAGVCVAILARNVEWSVRTSAGLSLSGSRRNQGQSEDHEHDPAVHLEHARNICTFMSR